MIDTVCVLGDASNCTHPARSIKRSAVRKRARLIDRVACRLSCAAKKNLRPHDIHRKRTVRQQLFNSLTLESCHTYAVSSMHGRRSAGAAVFALFTAALVLVLPTNASGADDSPLVGAGAPLLRLFLKDGNAIISYGEFARVADRVVFSMPVGVDRDAVPDLQLVDLAADRIDWARTDRYSYSVRAARYSSTRAEADYALLTSELAQALNDVAQTADPNERLAIVQRVRKSLAVWPSEHFNFKQDEVRQNLLLLDEAIADLRAEAGSRQFDLSLTTGMLSAPPVDPLLPTPGVQDLIEQTALVAQLTDQPAQRVSLLGVVLATIQRHLTDLPSSWIEATRTSVQRLLRAELAIDRAYQALVTQIVGLASARAKAADVRGVQHLADEVRKRDEELGKARPETVDGLLAAVEHELDAARRLRLERDRWALRLPELRRYQTAVGPSLARLRTLEINLEDIKALSGSSPDAIGALIRWATDFRSLLLAAPPPPDEVRDVHDLLLSVAQLVESAAKIRREAALVGSLDRAWNASSAAAGALMLSAKARADLQAAVRPPELPH